MVTTTSLDFDAEGFGSVPERGRLDTDPEGFGVYFGAGPEGEAFETFSVPTLARRQRKDRSLFLR